MLDDALVGVFAEEAAGVVAGEAEGGLGQIVGAEGEELGRVPISPALRQARGSSTMVPTE